MNHRGNKEWQTCWQHGGEKRKNKQEWDEWHVSRAPAVTNWNTREGQAERNAKGNGKNANAGNGPDNRSATSGKGCQSHLRGSGEKWQLKSVPFYTTDGNIDDDMCLSDSDFDH